MRDDVRLVLTDAKLETREARRPETLDDVADAVVSATRPRLANAHLARRQVDVVLDHQEIRRRRVVVLHDRRHRVARQVHVGLRLHEHHRDSRERALRHQTLKLALRLPRRADFRGNRIDRLKTNRVRSIRILRTRVT